MMEIKVKTKEKKSFKFLMTFKDLLKCYLTKHI